MIPLCLLAAAALSHWAALAYPLLSLADLPHALGSPGPRDWRNLTALISPAYGEVFWEGSYHPLYTFATMVNYSLFGFNPFGFRIFMLLAAWFNGLLLARLAREKAGNYGWLAGFLYVTHPAHVGENMLDLKDSLVTLFCLLGLLSQRRSFLKGYPLSRCLAVGACFLLAVSSKETGVVFPLLLLVMDWSQGAIPGPGPKKRRWWACYLFLAAAALAYAAFRVKIVNVGGGVQWSVQPVSWNFVLLRFKQFVLEVIGQGPGFFSGLGLPAALAALVLAASGGLRLAAGCAAWILLGFLPYSGLIPVRSLVDHLSVTDVPARYAALSSAGYAWLLALAWKKSLGRGTWALRLAPLFLSANLLGGLFFHVRPEGFRWLSACSRKEAVIEGGGACVSSLMQALISRPVMRDFFPESYREIDRELLDILGEKAQAMEALFGKSLADPCQVRYFIDHVAGTPMGTDIEALYRDMSASPVISACREEVGRGNLWAADSGYRLAQLCHGLGFHRLELKIIERSARRRPRAVGLQIAFAEAAIEAEDSSRKRLALDGLAAALQAPPGTVKPGRRSEFDRQMVGLFMRLGDTSRALDSLGGGRLMDADLLLELARLAEGLNRPADAVKALAALQKIDLSPELRIEAAFLYSRLGRFAEALALFERVAEGSRSARARLEQAKAAAALGRVELALRCLDGARRLALSRPQRHAAAMIYQTMGRYGQALEILRSLLKAAPEDEKPGLLHDRAVCRQMSGDSGGALEDILSALRLKPDWLAPYLTLGAIFVEQGHCADALAAYDRALALPGSPGADALRQALITARGYLLKRCPAQLDSPR